MLLVGVCLSSSPVLAQGPDLQSEKAGEVVALVEKATILINAKGVAAFDELRQKGSEWYHDDTYVFVDTIDATTLLNPPKPEIEGKNFLDFRDAAGKVFHHDFIALLRSSESGWVDYMWPKPGQTQPARKWAYIRRIEIGGQLCWVGSGVYLDQ